MLNQDNHIIDELLASYLLDEASPENRVKVEDWIASNPVNKKYFEHFRLILEASRQIILPQVVDEKQAWQRFKARVEKNEKGAAALAPLRNLAWLRVAAGIVIILAATTLAYFVWNRNPATPVVFATTATSRADTLSDGSVVTLNKHSEIAYMASFPGKERRVDLKGEAFFKVKSDTAKAFIVHVNDVVITVVGTAFNVKSVSGNTEIIVESGTVNVRKNNTERLITKGQKIVASKKGSTLTVEANTDVLYNYYRSKEFVCDNTPLWKLVTVLNEAYDSRIIIENKSLSNLPLTTTFSNESLDSVLKIIGETFNIRIDRRQDGSIILK